MKRRWIPGNQVRLLENGEAFYPAVFDAIAQAKKEVLLETFIIFEDKVGLALKAALLQAAANGARVDVLVDGFGTADLSRAYLDELANAGVRVRAFDPSIRIFGKRMNWMRRMHRKLVVVDGHTAFVGGINYSADHLGDFGPEAKQDYAVVLHGPIVDEIRAFMRSVLGGWGWGAMKARWSRWRERFRQRGHPMPTPHAGSAQAMLVMRDNVEHFDDIERHYRIAIRAARKRVIIANAYFFPGWRLLRELLRAARRGVEVTLILQGEPDVPLARQAAQMLYEDLRRGGVRIYEYCQRPLHGKVAVVDDEWATVGSSNLDPLSLALNLEANVILRDPAFNAELAANLEHLRQHACKEITEVPRPRWAWWAELRGFAVFHFIRNFSSWANWLPRHVPRLARPEGLPEPVPQPQPQPQPPAVPAEGQPCHAR
jgi:cardiolipin synthase